MPKNGFSYNYRKPLNKLIFECMFSLVYSYEFSVINSSVNQHLRKHLHSVDGTDTSGCTEWIQSCKRWHHHPLRRSFWKTSHPFLQRYDGRERYKMLHKTEIGARCKEGRCFSCAHTSATAVPGHNWVFIAKMFHAELSMLRKNQKFLVL